MSKPLSPRHQLFVDEYLQSMNAADAYRKAGFKATGTAANVSASRLLKRANIASAIAKALADRSKRTHVDADYVVNRLVLEAENSGEGSSHSARVRALELLGKHLGMFVDKVEHSGNVGPRVIIGVSRTEIYGEGNE